MLFWSFGSSLIFLGARQAGTWPFVAIAALVGGGAQLIGWRLYRGGLRSAVWLPWRLWAVSLPCFVLYGLVWPWALVSSSAKQVFGVSLINYLWPVLTVLFSAWWVPGARLTTRTVLATFLALAGLVCANLQHIRDLLAAGDSAGVSPVRRFLPYGLALVAAVTWAVYSTLLARWRDWARNYVTSPVGFLLTGTIACAVTAFTGSMPAKLSAPGTLMIICYGAGPLGGGLSVVGNRSLQGQGPHPEPACRRHPGAFHLPALPFPADLARTGIGYCRLAGGRWSAAERSGVAGTLETACPRGMAGLSPSRRARADDPISHCASMPICVTAFMALCNLRARNHSDEIGNDQR